MIWKAIGQSEAGTSHVASGKSCEDNITYTIVADAAGEEVLVCCASDGAGSAKFGGRASEYTTQTFFHRLTDFAKSGNEISEADIYTIAEDVYEALQHEAEDRSVELNEFSCTLLGMYITKTKACFFQIGDGAIVRNDGSGFYVPVWWPFNGEYQNTTSFLIDDPTLPNLNIQIIEGGVDEVALFTDGLQMLILNTEEQNVHQPFFEPFFRYLRLTTQPDQENILKIKLSEYLNSAVINTRTDDDKTLFLASRASSVV